ncbi:MAG: YitT family protein [Defluviitaleaceae bacterium]|nr:YitT family protein [Defluviitaleaceae bacterium]
MDTAKYWIKKLFFIVLAINLIAVGVNMFLGPHNIAAGGLTGLAVILEAYMGFDRAITVWIGNGIVVLLALAFLGKEVFFNTVIGAGLLPVFIGLIPQYTLVEDRMLSMIIGSALFGIAVSMLYYHKASSGGTAVPPLIMKKYFGISPSIGLFIADGVVVTLCLLVFDVDTFFFAILSIFITMIVMNYIENGTNKVKRVHIISKHHEAIAKDIMDEIKRGVTIISAKGAYEKTELPMLMVTIDKGSYRSLIEIIDRHDKEAFCVTDVVSNVHGKGFTFETGSV